MQSIFEISKNKRRGELPPLRLAHQVNSTPFSITRRGYSGKFISDSLSRAIEVELPPTAQTLRNNFGFTTFLVNGNRDKADRVEF
jgi:hypothetical protein